jgi:glycosyltransferase involved in cell wall biosynthesis
MKINALSTSGYPPKYSPMSHRLHCYMLALKEEGHDVKVYFFSNEYVKGDYEGISFESIIFDYKNCFIYSFSYLRLFENALSAIIREAHVFFHSEDRISKIYVIQKIANEFNVKTVLELNEYPYGYKSRRLEFSFLQLIRQKIYFHFILSRVGGVISISESLKVLAGSFNDKVIRVPILTKYLEIKRSPKAGITPYILHAGALSENKDGIRVVVEAFCIAKHRLNGNLKLVFTVKKGLPELMRWIDDFARVNNLNDSIIFKGIVEKDELDSLYNDCLMAIVNKPNNLQNRHNFPTKLAELLPRRIPVIISSTGELKFYFRNNDNCLLVKPNNIDEISDGIVQIAKNVHIRNKISKNALRTSQEKFYYKNYSNMLSNFFINV